MTLIDGWELALYVALLLSLLVGLLVYGTFRVLAYRKRRRMKPYVMRYGAADYWGKHRQNHRVGNRS